MNLVDRLAMPIVQAPMAGGASTPALAAAVSGAGGLGFVAAGYRTVEGLAGDLAAARERTDAPFGVNVFAPTGVPADPAIVAAYMSALAAEAQRAGVGLGEPRFDEDAYAEKIDLLVEDPVAVVSFVFGLPGPASVRRLHDAGSEVWLTVTTPQEALQAIALHPDALVVQGFEAGGHRGAFDDAADPPQDFGVLALLQLTRAAVGPELPLVAAGGITTGAGIAAVLVAGAAAAQVGTAYLLTPEAGTPPVQRELLPTDRPTAVTRAYSGRRGRGMVNRIYTEHHAHAPVAYPEIHHVTSPLRAHGRKTGDPDLFNLWAGQAHALAPSGVPAAELTRRLAEEARAAVAETHARLSGN
jgi:nitronate monooxygenase